MLALIAQQPLGDVGAYRCATCAPSVSAAEHEEDGEDTRGCRESEEERENRAKLREAGLLSVCRWRKSSYSDAERETLEELVERYRCHERFEVGAEACESEPDDE